MCGRRSAAGFLSSVDISIEARFPFKRNRLRCVRCVNKKTQETQALALASSQSWLPLLRPSIPIVWRLRLLRENATHATQAIAFEWKPGLTREPI